MSHLTLQAIARVQVNQREAPRAIAAGAQRVAERFRREQTGPDVLEYSELIVLVASVFTILFTLNVPQTICTPIVHAVNDTLRNNHPRPTSPRPTSPPRRRPRAPRLPPPRRRAQRRRRRRRARRRGGSTGARSSWRPPQLRAAPNPCIRSRISGGFSMICEKRTTVTVSSIDTLRP